MKNHNSEDTFICFYPTEHGDDCAVEELTKKEILKKFPGEEIKEVCIVKGVIVKPFDRPWNIRKKSKK